jgi:predicted nucleotidyltransferase
MTENAAAVEIAPEIFEQIQTELRDIEAKEQVRILFAVESGSRAWGFPSPDSDYDVRFVYARPMDWYLSIRQGRDVIECPLEGELDVNGWDIKKALGLLLKPNPVLLEWLSSPIRYRWNDAICRDLISLADKVAHGTACLHHYLNLASRQWAVYIDGKDQVNLKKYFYVVRPAMALRWIRLRRETTPPMNFHALAAGIELPTALTSLLEDLLARKSRSKELGEAPRIPEIDSFITAELDQAREAAATVSKAGRDLSGEADALFRNIVKGAPL